MDLCLTNGRIENEGEKLFRDRGDNVQWGVMRLEAMVPSWLVAQSDQPSQTWKKVKQHLDPKASFDNFLQFVQLFFQDLWIIYPD